MQCSSHPRARRCPADRRQVADIPRTPSGKMSAIAVRDVIHGRAIKSTGALANSDALALYHNLEPLRS